jgi:high affinity Mn2+ porin
MGRMGRGMRQFLISAAWLAVAMATPCAALADEAAPAPDQAFAAHVQFTDLTQFHPAFRSAYRGPNSLDPGARGDATNDLTVYLGARLWRGAEIWANPEIDQGFGLSNTLGVAGFPSGEAYKIGQNNPYLKLQRLFLRQTIDLGGASEAVEADANQLGGRRSADRLVLTIGKFGVGDVFDSNRFAHDPRADFMNWTVIDTGSFDYAADAWGYAYGVTAEWCQGDWTGRAGLFDLSDVPNSPMLDPKFDQFQIIAELEHRHSLAGQPGAVRLTGFLTRGRMGHFGDALRLAAATDQPPDVALVRQYGSRGGVSLTAEQQITGDLGAFVRVGFAEGDSESYEFTDVDATGAAGLSLAGQRWGRGDDTLGAAVVVNAASARRLAYLAAGGLGILIGDGALVHSGPETIFETYYSLAVVKGAHLSADYQFIDNPAYNRDRGPVSVLSLRAHVQY